MFFIDNKQELNDLVARLNLLLNYKNKKKVPISRLLLIMQMTSLTLLML